MGGRPGPHTLPVFQTVFPRNLRKGKIFYSTLLRLIFVVWLMTISVSYERRQFCILIFRFANPITPSQEHPLSCSNRHATCGQIGDNIGCCMVGLDYCTAVPTTCIDYSKTCDIDCRIDRETLYCSQSYEPYCATYFFDSTAELYGCHSTTDHTLQATHLSDYYSSVLGPGYTTYSNIGIATRPSSIPLTDATTDSGGTSTAAGQTSEPTEPKSEDGGGDGGFSAGAIAGVVVGVLAVVAGFAAFLVWVFFIKRKKNKNPSPPPPPATQPVQQIAPDGGVSPMAGAQQAGYDQPPPPMPYNQYNPNGSSYFYENKIGPTSPTDPPQYSQPYNPPQETGHSSGYQACSPGAPQQPQSPPQLQASAPAADHQNHSHNNNIHIPPGGSTMNEMEGLNNVQVSGANPPTRTEYELGANNADPAGPIYELPIAR